MSKKKFYTTPKPKYGLPRLSIHAYDGEELVRLTHHRQGLETQMAEAILVQEGFVKGDWADKPKAQVQPAEEEDEDVEE